MVTAGEARFYFFPMFLSSWTCTEDFKREAFGGMLIKCTNDISWILLTAESSPEASGSASCQNDVLVRF